MTLAVLNCPSDDPGQLTTGFGPVSYAASFGASPAGNGLARPDGLFGHIGGSTQVPIPPGYGPDEPIVTSAMVTDGLSNTSAFSERCYGLGTRQQQRRPGQNTHGDVRLRVDADLPG